jgi:hypothetical protein
VGERRTTATWRFLEPSLCQRQELRRRDHHLNLVSVKGDEENFVSGLVHFLQKRHCRTLGCAHSIQGHEARGVHDKDNETTRLVGHALDTNVAVSYVDQLVFIGVAAPDLLVGSCRSKGSSNRNMAFLPVAFRKDSLDESATLQVVDTRSLSARTLSRPFLEFKNPGINGCGIDSKHKLFWNLNTFFGLFLLFLFFLAIFTLNVLFLITRR